MANMSSVHTVRVIGLGYKHKKTDITIIFHNHYSKARQLTNLSMSWTILFTKVVPPIQPLISDVATYPSKSHDHILQFSIDPCKQGIATPYLISDLLFFYNQFSSLT